MISLLDILGYDMIFSDKWDIEYRQEPNTHKEPSGKEKKNYNLS